MKDKKILFLINKLGIGGAERVFIKTANALTKRGFDVYFAFLLGKKEEQILLSHLNIPDKNIFYCKAKSFSDFTSLKRLSAFLKENGISTVCSTLNEANIFARLLKVVSPGASILIREANVASPKPLHFKILDSILNIFVKKIICVSEEVKNSLLKYQPFYESKMVVLMNGVEMSEISKKYPDKIELPLKILNVGSLTPKKGQRYLIEACGIVEKQYPNSFALTIIGKGEEKKNLLREIKELGLQSKASIIDPVSPKELSNYYLSSDLFILSSLWEGCPNALLEAMAHGVASVSTRVSGANDIIEEGKSGKLVPVGDTKGLAEAIIYFIETKNELATFGKKGMDEMIKNFSMSIYLDRLTALFG